MKLGNIAMAIFALFFVSVAFAQVANDTTNGTNTTIGNDTNVTPPSNESTPGNNTTDTPTNNTNNTLGNETNGTIGNETEANDTLEDPGVTPSSPLWGIDIALDRLRYLLTFDRTERARVGLAIAEERLAEIKASAESGDISSVEKAKLKHDEILTKVKESYSFTTSDNQSVEFTQSIKIGEQVDKYKLKVETELQKIDVKIQTKGDLTEEQRTAINSYLTQVQNSTQDIKVKVEVKDGRFEVKIKQGTEETELEIDAEKIKEQNEKVLEEATKLLEKTNEAAKKAEEKVSEFKEAESKDSESKNSESKNSDSKDNSGSGNSGSNKEDDE